MNIYPGLSTNSNTRIQGIFTFQFQDETKMKLLEVLSDKSKLQSLEQKPTGNEETKINEVFR